MSIIGTVHEDVTSDVLGKIGTWQWMVTVISAVLMMPSLFNQYEDMFLLNSSNVYCTPPSGLDVFNSSLCFITKQNNVPEIIKCEKWTLKFLGFVKMKKKWLVFCDDKIKLLSTAIISRFGLVFGCVIFGLISDSFGRRLTIVLYVVAELIFSLIITFCDSEGWFRLTAFLKSLFGSANLYMGIILVCELASNEWRSWLCTIVMSPRLFHLICMVPLANSAPNVETYSFIACLYCCFCLALLRWVPESPQWLLYNRKIIAAEQILAKAAATNGIKLCNSFKIRPVSPRAYHDLENTTNCIELITIHNVRVVFLGTVTFWFLYYFLWSYLYVRTYSREENKTYLLLKVFCSIVVLGCLTVISSVKLMLRYLLLTHVILSGAFTTVVSFFQKEIIHTFISSIALASGVVAHALIMNITPRYFAINIRATVFGTCHATGQLGSIISYLLFLFYPLSDITIMGVELAITIILGGLCFLMPDVDCRELPDVLTDMDYFSELSKPLRWATQKTSCPSLEEVQMRVYSFGSTQRSLSHSYSNDKIPAQNIGFSRLLKTLKDSVRQKLITRRNVEDIQI